MKYIFVQSVVYLYGVCRCFIRTDSIFYKYIYSKSYFLYKKYLEDPHSKLLKKYPDFIGSGQVLDVGANIGYTTLLFAEFLSTGCKVYAFEPEKVNYDLLNYNITKSRLKNLIETFHSAVSDGQSGNLSLKINKLHPGDHKISVVADSDSEQQIVSAISIDSFVAEKLAAKNVSMIKIDVQGHERYICMGMQKTLESNKNINISIELSESNQVEEIFSFFLLLWF